MEFVKITFDGIISIVNIGSDVLDGIHREIGGFEIVRTRFLHTMFPEPVVMIVDDNFFAHKKPYNPVASTFYPGDICGDVLLIPEFCGEFVPFNDIDHVLNYLVNLGYTISR